MADTSTPAKAVSYSGRGGYDVVGVSERSVRPAGQGEVRIRVSAAAVNPTDILLRDPGHGTIEPPLTPGMDAAGVIESVGPGVTRLSVGDEVMAAVSPLRPEGGAQAALIVVPAASVVTKPQGIGLKEAATLPMNGLTAFYAIEHAALSPGDVFAVSGGAGWLAYLAIVLAKQQGLRVVTDAKAEEIEAVKDYGADIVVERSDDFAGAVRAQVPEGVGALLDTALLGDKAFGAIRDGGIYIPVRGWTGPEADRGIKVKRVMVPEVLERTEWLERIRDLAAQGTLVPRIAAEFAPEAAVDAQKRLQAGGIRGRLVVVFD